MGDRGTGYTTTQMQRAPRNAIFISCCTRAVDYDKALARHLGRDDLNIKSPSVFDNDGEQLRGIRIPGFVIDHAFWGHPETGRRRSEGQEYTMRWLAPVIERDSRF